MRRINGRTKASFPRCPSAAILAMACAGAWLGTTALSQQPPVRSPSDLIARESALRLSHLQIEPQLTDPNGKTFAPGDTVIFPPPAGKTGPWTVMLKNTADSKTYSVPLNDMPALAPWTLKRVTNPADKSPAKRYPSFIVPQVPRGKYEVWHQSSASRD